MAAGLSVTKFDGALTTVFLFLVLVSLYKRISLTAPVGKRLGWLVLSIGLPLCWICWVRHMGWEGNLVHFRAGISMEKILVLLKLNLNYFFTHNLTFLALMTTLYLFIGATHRKMSVGEIFLLRLALLLVLMSAFGNIGLPREGIEGAFSDAYPRLFLHAAPVLLLFFSSRLLVDEA